VQDGVNPEPSPYADVADLFGVDPGLVVELSNIHKRRRDAEQEIERLERVMDEAKRVLHQTNEDFVAARVRVRDAM